MLRRSRTLNGTKMLSITLYFLVTINIFCNPLSKLIIMRLALMISSKVKDTVSLLTFLVPLVLVSNLHSKKEFLRTYPVSFPFFFFPCLQGKTFSAEATSEFVRKPLYVVGGGDLGTTAANLDRELKQIFDVATAWKAIVLIDEVSS